jgi:staphylococcal nuclease domain-containing protein 1
LKTVPPDEEAAALKSEYLDVIVSDVRTNNGLGFSVQILNTEGGFILCVDGQP